MDWILDHFKFVALIAIVTGSLVKRYLEAKAAENQARGKMDPPGDPSDDDDSWQPPRNQPLPSVPPPLVRQNQAPVMRPSAPPPLRVEEMEVSAILKRQHDMQERLQQIKSAKSATSGGAAATSARAAAAQSHAKAPVPVKTGLRGALRDRQQIRRAIIMREVLGPPLGLR